MWPPADDVVTAVARAATGRPDAEPGPWRAEPLGPQVDNMTTEGLHLVVGELADGTPWRAVAKVLQPASASPFFAFVPPDLHGSVLTNLDWTDEPRLYRCGLADDPPPGVRLPELYAFDEGAERSTLWLEHVVDAGGWDVARYASTAAALGGWSARWPEATASAALGLGRRDYRDLFFGKVSHADLPRLGDDATWDDPDLRSAIGDDPDLRDDLRWMASRIPDRLDRLDRLPHALAHGDAAPSNLLLDEGGTIVAIDWSYGSVGAIGSDLAQLLAGGAEAGGLRAPEIETTASTIFEHFVEAFVSGGDASGASRDLDRGEVGPQVAEASATMLAIRSGFSALLLDDPRPAGDERGEQLRSRAALARHAVDAVRATD
jgi:hypothetical protein